MKNIIQSVFDKAGGPTALAKTLGITPQALHKWAKRQQIPAERVIELERVTGISRHAIRPDIYPRDAV